MPVMFSFLVLVKRISFAFIFEILMLTEVKKKTCWSGQRMGSFCPPEIQHICIPHFTAFSCVPLFWASYALFWLKKHSLCEHRLLSLNNLMAKAHAIKIMVMGESIWLSGILNILIVFSFIALFEFHEFSCLFVNSFAFSFCWNYKFIKYYTMLRAHLSYLWTLETSFLNCC